MNNELQNIDKAITTQLDILAEVVDGLTFKEIAEFNLVNSKDEIKWDELKYSGIYLLEIKNNSSINSFEEWVENFQAKWEKPDYLNKSTPSIKKKRKAAHNQLNQWVPIYLGKAKNIRRRIWNHLYLELDKPTSSLKLLARKNLHKEIFRVSTIRLDLKNYNALVPFIESALRDKLNPIIGKQ